MRFDSIHGDAFGPFKGQELQFGPGFTVVHGMNESGKSSWAAALYASLAGRRRARGRGSRDDAQFRARHKPWSGRRWQATAKITTDDGTALALQQDLAQGTTRVIDLSTNQVVTSRELEARFGIPPATGDDIDIGQLVGLSRGTLRATTFVPQADVLRVIDQAGELQQFLQRAASSQTVDVTASEVLDGLRAAHSTRIGSVSVGMRPLRAAQQHLRDSEDRAYRLRTARDELRQVAADLGQQGEADERAQATLAELKALQRYQELDSLQEQLSQVRSYDAQLSELRDVPDPAPEELIERVQAARTAYLTLGQAHSAPDGPGSDELEAQLAALPEQPTGDTTPEPGVRDQWEQLHQAISGLSSLSAAPQTHEEERLPEETSEDLRHLADDLRRERPQWNPTEDDEAARLQAEFDAAQQRYDVVVAEWAETAAARAADLDAYKSARDEYEAQHAQYETDLKAHRAALDEWEAAQRRQAQHREAPVSTKRPGMWQLVLGGVLVAGGIATLLLEPIGGAVMILMGLVLLGWGVVARRRPHEVTDAEPERTPDRPSPPTPPSLPNPPENTDPGARPAEPTLSPLVADIARRREAWALRADEWDRHRADLVGLLRSRELPETPDELHQLARKIDERVGARTAAAEREATAERLRSDVDDAARQLLLALAGRGERVDGLTSAQEADQAYRRYELACQDREAQARTASRREAIEQALTARRSEEQAHGAAVARRANTVAALIDLTTELGLPHHPDPDAAAAAGKSWLSDQEEIRNRRHRRDQLAALRTQLLDGSNPDELSRRIEDLGARLGPRPDYPAPPDLEDAVAEAQQRAQQASTLRASTQGRLSTLRADEGDLAAALDEATQHQRKLSAVEGLRDTLDLAIESLEAAQGQAHRSLAPMLEAAMRSRVPAVTGGRYMDVRVDPEDLSVQLQESAGPWRDAAYLSHGTTEQTYLLLRIALVEHLDTSESMPLVLDDVTVQCDAVRTVALLELLADVARQRQVILFSQESGVLAWAEEHLDPNSGDRLVSLTTRAA